MNQGRVKVVACATVVEEMLPLLPEGMTYEVLDFGLHLAPDRLRHMLQEAIDAAAGEADTIVLGYGLCSMAAVGLRATDCTLVVPRVDDCIAIFLGSDLAYKAQARQEPGTYYLTKGWIEVNETPFAEHERLVEQYGADQADRMTGLVLKNYTRLAFIDTGHYEQQRYRAYARSVAERFGLRYEQIPGSTALIKKMLYGPWDDDFVIARPGHTITYADFKRTVTKTRCATGLSIAPMEAG
ncbi:MAG: DUF1638 domain-containing protein [Anaerolineales bacterium]|nr:MAG: DUF1638 domain-containing protein [Anaerolineales bacterium]